MSATEPPAADPAVPPAEAPVPRVRSMLLVTGNRALADFPESQDWAESELAGLIASEDWDVVFEGGCSGSPDVWAREAATRLGVPWVEYRLDGKRYGSDGKVSAWWKGEGKCHPHQRNQAMVDLCVKQRAAGWNVRVVGLLAPWTRTQGAQVTLAMGKKAKLPVVEHVCARVDTEKTCVCGLGMTRRWTSWTCTCGKSELR